MAKAGDSAALPIWTSWSPNSATNPSKVPRRYVQIPSDQQRLLDRPDAWSAGGIPNVPPRVLEDLRAHHVTQPRPRPESASPIHTAEEARSPQPSSPARSTAADAELPQKRFGTGDEDHEAEELSDSDTPMSWPPSPSAHLRGPYQQENSVTAEGTQGRDTAEGTQGRDSPEQRRVRTTGRTVSRNAFADFPPSSSVTSELGLELEVPGALTDAPEPRKRGPVNLLEPTPPSAQIIPCTLAERTSPIAAPKPKCRRVMKSVAATFAASGPIEHENSSRRALPGVRPAPLPRSSSSVVRSSPPLPALEMHRATETSPVMLSVEDSNSPDNLPPNGPPSQVPFTAFTVAYPDYQGSVNDFLRGTLCLLQLQKDKALPEFLYDDFMRVFSGDYFDYISTTDQKQPALPAIHWYNENVSRPLFVKGILTKDNIRDVPQQYPEKMRVIQQKLTKSKADEAKPRATRQTPDTARGTKPIANRSPIGMETAHAPQHNGLSHDVLSASPALTIRKGETPTNVASTAEEAPPMRESRGTVSQVERDTDFFGPASALQPGAEAGKIETRTGTNATSPEAWRTQVDSSLRVIEAAEKKQRVTTASLSVASPFPSTALSQISNPESIPEATLRRRIAPRASAGPSAGEPGAEFKRPKRAANDAESRAQRGLFFRKYLIQKKTQSSAPEGPTPE